MKKILTILLLLNAAIVFSQKDSVKVKQTEPLPAKAVQKTDVPNQAKVFEGISVSPSSIRMALKPGSTHTREVKVVNDSKNKVTFRVGISDFTMGRNGSPMQNNGQDNKYGLSRWMTASPSFFELTPGTTQKITLTITVPGTDDGFIAAWSILTIDQVAEKTSLNQKGDDKTMSMGVVPSVGFGVYVFQNPPNVKTNEVEIQRFAYKDSLGRKNLSMKIKNIGDGIGFCTSYVELTGLNDGKKQKLNLKQFTVLPGYNRDFYYELPKGLAKGKYSAVGVIDYSNEQEIKAAELEFIIE